VYGYLKSRGHRVRDLNIRSEYTPRTKVLLHPDLLRRIVSGGIRGEKGELIVQSVHSRLGMKLLSNTLGVFKPDLIWCEGVFPAFLAISTVQDRIPVVADAHGILSLEYEENPFHRVAKERVMYLRGIEEVVFSRSWKIITVSNPMKKYVMDKHKVSDGKVHVVPNGSEVRTQRSQYGEPLKVIYAGIFAFWENLDSYLDLAKTNRKCHFYLAGDGPLRRHIFERIRNERIDVQYLGSLSHQSAIRKCVEMNVGVAPSVDTMTRRVACPIKVFDYLSCGLPVITSAVGEWAEIVQRNMCGLVTQTSDGRELSECIDSLDRNTWNSMSLNGLRLIRREFNWDALLSRIDGIMKACH
jgi:glycosyltransferase involved in cell wall biosynthesis